MIQLNQTTEKGIRPEKNYIIRQQKARMVMCCCMRNFFLVMGKN
ncbi:MAG: hypothetical protein NTY10_06415 [Candidatus Omnitrophica bacterium]|nr:hypothetical protein [Candidatus Omnitrophota bacterium]